MANFDDINLIVNTTYLQQKQQQQRRYCRNFWLISAVFAFSVGLFSGLFLSLFYFNNNNNDNNNSDSLKNSKSSDLWTVFVNNKTNNHSFVDFNRTIINNNRHFNSVSFVADQNGGLLKKQNQTLINQYINDDIYWGDLIETKLPNGYNLNNYKQWKQYINNINGIKLDLGCGRMQNRLIYFNDGNKGCIRYRQNIDQIQGELFSFYLGQILNLNNLLPTTISIIDFNLTIWQNLLFDIQQSQWLLNKPVVITKFIDNLDSANIPKLLRPNERHLNKLDILQLIDNNNNNDDDDNEEIIGNLVELAQWSDLIIFDYLTANLDRIVNNLYNYQWNTNIMDAPAHNLARQLNNNLLIFLDNESGLLHGYRLLKKYEIYHQNLLENLCLFRRKTVQKIIELKQQQNVGQLLLDLFLKFNNKQIQDILPTLPEKSIKILNERIDNVYQQIKKCQLLFKTN